MRKRVNREMVDSPAYNGLGEPDRTTVPKARGLGQGEYCKVPWTLQGQGAQAEVPGAADKKPMEGGNV